MTNEYIVNKNKVLVLQGKCYHPSMHNNKTDEGCTFHYLCFIQKHMAQHTSYQFRFQYKKIKDLIILTK